VVAESRRKRLGFKGCLVLLEVLDRYLSEIPLGHRPTGCGFLDGFGWTPEMKDTVSSILIAPDTSDFFWQPVKRGRTPSSQSVM